MDLVELNPKGEECLGHRRDAGDSGEGQIMGGQISETRMTPGFHERQGKACESTASAEYVLIWNSSNSSDIPRSPKSCIAFTQLLLQGFPSFPISLFASVTFRTDQTFNVYHFLKSTALFQKDSIELFFSW